MKKVVFFDRDDTLIVDRIYLNDPEDICYLPHALDCLKELRDYNYDFVIVTNQSGIAKGTVDLKNLREIHRRIRNEYSRIGVEILDLLYAPFLPVSNHFLRKPNPGMLLEAAHKYNIDLKKSWMVGDRMTDIEAGQRAGTKTILIGDKESPEKSPYAPPDFHARDLFEVSAIIKKHSCNN